MYVRSVMSSGRLSARRERNARSRSCGCSRPGLGAGLAPLAQQQAQVAPSSPFASRFARRLVLPRWSIPRTASVRSPRWRLRKGFRLCFLLGSLQFRILHHQELVLTDFVASRFLRAFRRTSPVTESTNCCRRRWPVCLIDLPKTKPAPPPTPPETTRWDKKRAIASGSPSNAGVEGLDTSPGTQTTLDSRGNNALVGSPA